MLSLIKNSLCNLKRRRRRRNLRRLRWRWRGVLTRVTCSDWPTSTNRTDPNPTGPGRGSFSVFLFKWVSQGQEVVVFVFVFGALLCFHDDDHRYSIWIYFALWREPNNKPVEFIFLALRSIEYSKRIIRPSASLSPTWLAGWLMCANNGEQTF